MCCGTIQKHQSMCRSHYGHSHMCHSSEQKGFGLRFSGERKKGEMLKKYLEELKDEVCFVEKLISELEE